MAIIRLFPKIFQIGHRALSHLFDDEVEVSSKIDGSQFRIYLDKKGIFEVGTHNTEGLELLKARIETTKSNQKSDMFKIAVEQAERLRPILQDIINEYNLDGITIYMEYLRKKHHNGLNYDRIPKNNFYLFGTTYWIDNNVKNLETDFLIKLANRLDVEPLNILYQGKIDDQEELKKLLEIESILGGTKEEGIVIKNYKKICSIDLPSTEKYVGFPLAGKLVRDEYKEVQRRERSKQKSREGSINEIAETYLTEARFLKSVQHLKEENKLSLEKKDLAILIPEVLNDLLSEEKEHIDKIVLDRFYNEFKRKISSYIVKEYNQYLINQQKF